MKKECELCGDTEKLEAHGKCHPTAPVRAVLENGIMTLRCYVPSCDRLIAKFKVEDVPNDHQH